MVRVMTWFPIKQVWGTSLQRVNILRPVNHHILVQLILILNLSLPNILFHLGLNILIGQHVMLVIMFSELKIVIQF